MFNSEANKNRNKEQNDDDEVIKETGDASTEPVMAEEELPKNDRDESTREKSKSKYRSKSSCCLMQKSVHRRKRIFALTKSRRLLQVVACYNKRKQKSVIDCFKNLYEWLKQKFFFTALQ